MPNCILLIEADRTQAERFQAELGRYGLSVHTASDASGGAAAARALRPAAIILDAGLPDLDGQHLCHLLKADPQTTNIPIVLLAPPNRSLSALPDLASVAADHIPKDTFTGYNLVQALHHLGVV